ncbi:MAG: PDZ domain-containing protein [Gemmatimonadales bacterium]|nr:PDZ domain-containing protein [Gemmatimonadales bacterium]
MRLRGFFALGLGIGCIGAGAWFLRRASPAAAPAEPRIVGTRLFETVFSHVRSFAVDSLGEQELYRRAAAGVIDELDDPYAVLLLPGQTTTLSPSRPGPQGLYLDRRDGLVVVVATVPGSPADSVGLLPGDRLIGVDTLPIDATRLDAAARLLEGKAGTTVTLRVRRPRVRSVVVLELVRGPTPERGAVESATLSNRVGHVRVLRFVPGLADSVRQGIEVLRRSGALSVALDLRGTVGGDIADGAALADLFLGAGTALAVSKGRDTEGELRFTDLTPSPFDSLPVAVLVDEGTAGAAEVAAGALQDHDRAALLGKPTFGRGVTQSTFALGNDASLQLTTALWMTPSGRQIQRPPQPAGGDSLPRPKLKSDAGRTVLGGGGIVPDRVVEDSGRRGLILTEARKLLERAGSIREVLALVAVR